MFGNDDGFLKNLSIVQIINDNLLEFFNGIMILLSSVNDLITIVIIKPSWLEL